MVSISQGWLHRGGDVSEHQKVVDWNTVVGSQTIEDEKDDARDEIQPGHTESDETSVDAKDHGYNNWGDEKSLNEQEIGWHSDSPGEVKVGVVIGGTCGHSTGILQANKQDTQVMHHVHASIKAHLSQRSSDDTSLWNERSNNLRDEFQVNCVVGIVESSLDDLSRRAVVGNNVSHLLFVINQL